MKIIKAEKLFSFSNAEALSLKAKYKKISDMEDDDYKLMTKFQTIASTVYDFQEILLDENNYLHMKKSSYKSDQKTKIPDHYRSRLV